jgi:hypothetical protein
MGFSLCDRVRVSVKTRERTSIVAIGRLRYG